jgi:two-component system, OmpR family, sensor histidine kinase SenX3
MCSASGDGKLPMFIKRDQSKALQFGFLALLLISIAQVAWWVTENIHYARTIQQRMIALYQTEAKALTVDGPAVTKELADNLPPHLEFAPGSHTVRVRQDALDQLNDDARRRINRYLWEGGFFLVVLIAGTTILTTAIRHDRELRRRQQNFLAAVSHEFKSPLASIRLSAETLSLRSTEPITQRLSQRILDDNERLLRMVDNLLDTARLEEGRQTLKPEMIELRPVIAACVDELGDRARQHNIEIVYVAPELLRVSIDPEALATAIASRLLPRTRNAA